MHIGYHKTATTMLQKYYFQSNFGYQQIGAHEEVYRYITSIPYFNFSNSKKRDALTVFEGRIASAFSAGLSPVISSELLVGNPLAGGHESFGIMLKLKELFPSAKIMITVRRQPDAIWSLYKQFVKGGGVLSPDDFLFFSPAGYSCSGFDKAYYCYSDLVTHYQATFGADSVLVVPYESYHQDLSQLHCALQRLGWSRDYEFHAEKIKPSVNVSVGDATLPLLRQVNRLFKSDQNRQGLIRAEKVRLNLMKLGKLSLPTGSLSGAMVLREKLGKYYSGSNKALEELTGLNLGPLGYEL